MGAVLGIEYRETELSLRKGGKRMVSIVRVGSDHRAFTDLVRELDDELYQRYGAAQSAYQRYNRIEALDTVVIVCLDGIPAGCGCFKSYDEATVELKRIFVRPENRGKGISKTILAELERWAGELGYAEAILETGKNQHEAIGLYQKSGYFRTDNYGQYAGMADSVCFKKDLTIPENQARSDGK
jgi:putative acetyltransferase